MSADEFQEVIFCCYNLMVYETRKSMSNGGNKLGVAEDRRGSGAAAE